MNAWLKINHRIGLNFHTRWSLISLVFQKYRIFLFFQNYLRSKVWTFSDTACLISPLCVNIIFSWLVAAVSQCNTVAIINSEMVLTGTKRGLVVFCRVKFLRSIASCTSTKCEFYILKFGARTTNKTIKYVITLFVLSIKSNQLQLGTFLILLTRCIKF